MTFTMRDVHERFNEKVEVLPNGCHRWLASFLATGYGRFRLPGSGSRTVMAHRFAYERAHGPVPDGLVLDHLCRNRWCVNPKHLEAVTSAENIRRGKGAHLIQTGRCLRGHVLAEVGYVTTPRTDHRESIRISCLACRTLRRREWRAAHADEVRTYERERARRKRMATRPPA